MTPFAATVLPAALVAFCFAARRGEGWRDAAVRGLLLFGCAAALLTESLSTESWLRPGPVLGAWLVLAAAALAVARRRPEPMSPLPKAAAGEWLMAAAIVAVAAITLFISLLSPPNSADAMAYHMPRVVYWAQAGNVRFFPTVYYNQISQPPLAEYWMLHTWLLSGGDHFVNLVQWIGFFGSAVAVSLIARELGASPRGQAFAALFAATLPNGILQATGAKNDALLALWIAAMAYFAIRWRRAGGRQDLVGASLALALAVFTKATAWLFAPPLLLVLLGRRLPRAAPAMAIAVLLINGPQFVRNEQLSGSPFGYDSAQGDGFFRWRNERFGWRETASNITRNLSEQLGARSQRWNRGVYDAVVRAHRAIGISPDDPATTWPWTRFEPPRNPNHEANTANRWHLLALVLVLGWTLAARRWNLALFLAALGAGFVLFSFYLKWQLYLARLFLPLFVIGAAAAGAAFDRLRPSAFQALLALFLLNNTRPFLFENWVRPLKGPRSVLRTSRENNYFADMTPWHNREAFFRAANLLAPLPCGVIGLDISEFQLEYPAQALLRARKPGVRFVHTGVHNASSRYAANQPAQPCAVLCLDCAGKSAKIQLYSGPFGPPAQAGTFLVFAAQGTSSDVRQSP